MYLVLFLVAMAARTNLAVTDEIVNVEQSSNVDIRGRSMFRVDRSEHCVEGELVIDPRFSSYLGGKRVTISGPCFDIETDDVVCNFDGDTVDGEVLDQSQAVCVVPMVMRMGRKPFSVSVDGGITIISTGYFWFLGEDGAEHGVQLVDEEAWENGGLLESLVITWNPPTLESTTVDVEFVIFSDEDDATVTPDSVMIYPGAPNTGSLIIPDGLSYAEELIPGVSGAIRVSEAYVSSARQSIYSKFHSAQWYMNRFIHESVLQDSSNTSLTRSTRGLGGWIKRTVRKTVNTVKKVVKTVATVITTTVPVIVKTAVSVVSHVIRFAGQLIFGSQCEIWYWSDRVPPPWYDAGPVPCHRMQADVDPDFEDDPACENGKGCSFHKGAHHCVRSVRPSRTGEGQQACYDKEGKLLTFERGGGTYDRAHYKGHFNFPFIVIPYVDHFKEDVQPYLICCKLSTVRCFRYKEMRPTHDCRGYSLPGTGWTGGDPHLITFDGLPYTFNGVGEFYIMKVGNGSIIVQGRAERFIPGTGSVNATIWTAIAMKSSSSEVVELRARTGGIDVFINGQQASFANLHVQQYTGVKIQQLEANKKFQVSFDGGVSIQFSETSGSITLLALVTHPNEGKIRGLLGDWDGNSANDLRAPNGSVVPSTAQHDEIYYNFGMKWRIDESSSLFSYPPGRTYGSYQNLFFVPYFYIPPTSPSTMQQALVICGNNWQCQFDYIVTGNEALARATATTIQQYVNIAGQLVPIVTCGFPEVPADGSGNVTNGPVGATVLFQCDIGYSLQGQASRQCMPNGEWSGTTPQCLSSGLSCHCKGQSYAMLDTYDDAQLSVFTANKTLMSRWDTDPDDICKFTMRAVTKVDIGNAPAYLHWDWIGFAIGVHPRKNTKEKKNILFAQDTSGQVDVAIRGHGHKGIERLTFVNGVSVITWSTTSCSWTLQREGDHLMKLSSSCCPYLFHWQPDGTNTQWHLWVGDKYKDGTMEGMCGDCNGNADDDWKKCVTGQVFDPEPENLPIVAYSCVEGTNQGAGFAGGMRLASL